MTPGVRLAPAKRASENHDLTRVPQCIPNSSNYGLFIVSVISKWMLATHAKSKAKACSITLRTPTNHPHDLIALGTVRNIPLRSRRKRVMLLTRATRTRHRERERWTTE